MRTIGQVKRHRWTLKNSEQPNTPSRFWDRYRKLPAQVQEEARKAYRLFSQNPAHPSLRFERLAYDPRLWSVRITSSYRAVGVREGEEVIWFWIGSHDEFDRTFPRR